MGKDAGLLQYRRYRLVFLIAFAMMAFVACPDPLSVMDDVERDLDRPLPDVAEVEQVNDPGDPDLPYNTQPIWTWTGDPEFGTVPSVFRFRINGSEWTILVMDPEDEPPYSYSVADDEDEEGNPRHLFPGTFIFEVQERNDAGNWSASAETTTVILVREPEFVSVPPAFTNTATPSFSWQQWESSDDPPHPQFGALDTYTWRVEQRVDSQWQLLASESASGEPGQRGYTVESPLVDGLHRFGVAELNQGGERSSFVWTQFTVDTVAPGAPNVSGPTVVSDTDTENSLYTLSAVTDDTFAQFHWELLHDSGDPVPGYFGTTNDNPATLALALSSDAPGEGLGVGQYSLLVRQEDLAGNIGTARTVGVSVQSTPTGSVAMSIVFQDPVNEVFILDSPGTIPRGTAITVTLDSTNAFDDVMWLVNGFVVDGVPFTAPTTEASLSLIEEYTETLPLGVNRIAVLVEIDGNWYSSEDMTFEVVQP